MSQSVPAASIPEGTVTGVGTYAVGNNGAYFAVGRKCRHLRADLATGSIDAEGGPRLSVLRAEGNDARNERGILPPT